MAKKAKTTKKKSVQQKPANKGGPKKGAKKRGKKEVSVGRAYVQAGFSNTIITITDATGATVSWSSAGKLGFKGSRKGTPFAAQMTSEDAVKQAQESAQVKAVDVYIKGPGAGREPAVRAIASMGMKVLSIRDITPLPHNGCRPPKRRRV